jgi:hypothetical protein
MRNLVIFAALLAAPLTAQTVETGEGDWRNIPPIGQNMSVALGLGAMERIDKIVNKGACKALGRRGKITMAMPFIVEFNPDKSVARLVVKRIGCPEVEQIAASAALHAAKTGRATPTGVNTAGWYRGEVSYFLE